MPLEDFIIIAYCVVDDFLKSVERLRTRGHAPCLSDAEVLTTEIVGEYIKKLGRKQPSFRTS